MGRDPRAAERSRLRGQADRRARPRPDPRGGASDALVDEQQAWDFVVVTEREPLRELAGVWRYAEHVARSAATIAIVIPASEDPDTRETYQYDAGQATMSIMLAAADLGIGSGHAAVGDQDLARSLLGLPDDRECAWLIALGHPADRPLSPIARPDRRPLDDVVHRERW